MPQTITYRGPRVLVGALAHLLREEGVEFKQPREDRTEVVEVAVVVLAVRAGDKSARSDSGRHDRRRSREVQETLWRRCRVGRDRG